MSMMGFEISQLKFSLPGPIAACQDETAASDKDAWSTKQVAPGHLHTLLSLQAGVPITLLLEEGEGEQDDKTLGAATDCKGKGEASDVIEESSNGWSKHAANTKAGLTSSYGLAFVGRGHLRRQKLKKNDISRWETCLLARAMAAVGRADSPTAVTTRTNTESRKNAVLP